MVFSSTAGLFSVIPGFSFWVLSSGTKNVCAVYVLVDICGLLHISCLQLTRIYGPLSLFGKSSLLCITWVANNKHWCSLSKLFTRQVILCEFAKVQVLWTRVQELRRKGEGEMWKCRCCLHCSFAEIITWITQISRGNTQKLFRISQLFREPVDRPTSSSKKAKLLYYSHSSAI